MSRRPPKASGELHTGDRIESMAYDDRQIDTFLRCLEKINQHGARLKAILISGGGNDIVGDDFGMLLDSAVSPIHGWNAEILDGIFNSRIREAYCCLISCINYLCEYWMARYYQVA